MRGLHRHAVVLMLAAGCTEPNGAAVDSVNGLRGDVEIVSSNGSVLINSNETERTLDFQANESDPLFGASAAGAITQGNIDAWNTAAAFVESDPVFEASPASGIVAGDLAAWDTAFS